MVKLTRIHWILIIVAGTIVTTGVSIGIWQAILASGTVFTYEKCRQNSYFLVNNARYSLNDTAFTEAFNGPIIFKTEVATKYDCCNLCNHNLSCYLFEYTNKSNCTQYGSNGVYNKDFAISSLNILDAAYSSGYYSP